MEGHHHAEELAASLPQEWQVEFCRFVETGEAESAFLEFLDSDKAAQAAVETMFNEQAAALQRVGAWLHASKSDRPAVGDQLPDGTVYAGLSPDTGKPMFATQTDASLTMQWKQAMEYAAKLDAHGHHDWRVPTKGELNVLFQNRAAIGGFDESGSNPAGWYWSSSQYLNNTVWDQRFSDGCQDKSFKDYYPSLRCVR